MTPSSVLKSPVAHTLFESVPCAIARTALADVQPAMERCLCWSSARFAGSADTLCKMAGIVDDDDSKRGIAIA